MAGRIPGAHAVQLARARPSTRTCIDPNIAHPHTHLHTRAHVQTAALAACSRRRAAPHRAADAPLPCAAVLLFCSGEHKRHSSIMSWQAYVDNNLIGTRMVAQGAIHGLDGSKWASSPNFAVCAALRRVPRACGVRRAAC